MKNDGSDQKQITDENQAGSPSLSPDGEYIFYTSVDKSNLKPLLRKIPIEGGDSAQLTSLTTIMPKISPDGKWIVSFYSSAAANTDSFKDVKLTILSAENGKVIKQFDSDRPIKLSPLSWSDNVTFNYLTNEGEGARLWQQSIDKIKPQIILDSSDEMIFRFAFSPDGRKLVYEKGTALNDIILIKTAEN